MAIFFQKKVSFFLIENNRREGWERRGEKGG